MADGSNVALIAGTVSSLVLGAGALLRSMRQDTREAKRRETDAAVTALQRQVEMLLTQNEGHIRNEAAMRAEMDTERKERAAAEDRLRKEHAAAQDRLYATIRDLEVKVERCEAERADLIRQLASTPPAPDGQENTSREDPSP